MNGKLTVQGIKRSLTAKVEHLQYFYDPNTEFTIAEITDLLALMRDEMVETASTSPNREACKLFKDGADGHDGDYYLTHKIYAVKAVREAAHCGLKEAKDAVEQEIPGFLKEKAERTLKELAVANRVAGHQYAAYLNTSDHHHVLSNDSF